MYEEREKVQVEKIGARQPWWSYLYDVDQRKQLIDNTGPISLLFNMKGTIV
jgi:hypothetical protein